MLHCLTLWCTAKLYYTLLNIMLRSQPLWYTAKVYDTLLHIMLRCQTLWYTAKFYDTLPHIMLCCQTPLNFMIHWETLCYTAKHYVSHTLLPYTASLLDIMLYCYPRHQALGPKVPSVVNGLRDFFNSNTAAHAHGAHIL